MEIKTRKTVIMSLAIGINVIGALIAVTLKLPIFLDTIGTMIVAFIFGPIAAMVVGTLSYLVTTVTFDPYAIYFVGSQVVVGLMAGVLYEKRFFDKSKMFSAMIISLASAFVAAIAAAYVFGGITSSGNTIIIKLLEGLGLGLVPSVFLTQVLTEFIDKFIIITLALEAVKVLNKRRVLG